MDNNTVQEDSKSALNFQNIPSLISLVIAIGFVLGFIYEISYFYKLGTSPHKYLEIVDIVQTSLFFVPFALIGVIFGVISSFMDDAKERATGEPKTVPMDSVKKSEMWIKFFTVVSIIQLISFFIFGGPFIVLTTSLTYILLVAFPSRIANYFKSILLPKTISLCLIIVYFSIISVAAFGNFSAHNFLTSSVESLPQATTNLGNSTHLTVHPIRRFHSGVLATTIDNTFLFVPWKNIQVIEEMNSYSPWTGLFFTNKG